MCLSLDRKGQSRRAKFPKTVCVIGFFVIPTARKVPHRKWRAHGSGAPPRPLAPPSGHGEGRLAARAATLPTTRRSPHAPTRFSSRDLKVPLAGRKLRVGFPSGICEAPTGKSQPSQWEGAGSHWEVTRAVAASTAASKKAPIRPRLSLFAVTQISRLRCRRVAGLTLRGCSRLS